MKSKFKEIVVRTNVLKEDDWIMNNFIEVSSKLQQE